MLLSHSTYLNTVLLSYKCCLAIVAWCLIARLYAIDTVKRFYLI